MTTYFTTDLPMLLGALSAILSIFGFLPYIMDTLAGRTRPQRACWLIWSVLGGLSLGSQIYEGATASLGFAAVQVGGTTLICVLSVFMGMGRYLRRADYGILAAAAVGLGLWYLADDAAYALAIAITISLLGGAATVAKAYRAPGSETLATWVIFLAASVLAVASVGTWDPVLLAYPVYLMVLYASIIGATLLGRLHQRGPVFTSRYARRRSGVVI